MKRYLSWVCALTMLAFSQHSLAQQKYPSKPVTLIVPYATGGAPDILARLIANEMASSFGPTIVDNRGGASGNIGADFVANAARDGYTLLLTTTATHSINPSIYPKMPYDPLKDFTPISLVARTPLMLVVANDVPAKNLQELIAYAKKNQGKLSYASAGSGTMQHIAAELFSAQTGIEMAHIPYKGSGQVIPDLISGRVSLMFNSVAAVLPFVKQGKVRAIGVTTPKRTASAPEVPTLAEAGLPGFEASAWYAVYGPRGLPAEIVQRLNAEVAKAMKSASVQGLAREQGLDPETSTPEQLAEITRNDLARWAKVIKERNIRPD